MSWVDSIKRKVRWDSWANAITLLGDLTSDKTRRHLPIYRAFVAPSYGDALLYSDGFGRILCEELPRAALSQGWDLTYDGDSDGDERAERESAIREQLKQLQARDKLLRAKVWGRQKGRGGLLLGIDDGRPADQPLDWERVKSVDYLEDLEMDEFSAHEIDADPKSPTCGEPLSWKVMRDGASRAILVHTSRIILTGGVLTARRVRRENQYCDASVFDAPWDDLQGWDQDRSSARSMMADASQFILKIKGFLDVLASSDKSAFQERIELLRLGRSVANVLTVDADSEDANYVDRSFSGVDAILNMDQNCLAAVTRTPSTVLMGRSPAGLNATGDSDLSCWYDQIRSYRTNDLAADVTTLTRISAFAAEDPEPSAWGVTWPELWQMTAVEKADWRAKVAAADDLYIAAGVLKDNEVRLARFGGAEWSDQIPQIDIEETGEELESEKGEEPTETTETTPASVEADVPASVAENAVPPNSALNGAQVSALLEVVGQVVRGELPRASAVEIIITAFPVDRPTAERILGEVGKSFEPKAEEPAAAPGAPPTPGVTPPALAPFAEKTKAAAEGEEPEPEEK